METICRDLAAETAELDRLVAGLDESAWRTPTPADGWDVADQISHLWFFDQRAAQALTDPDAFRNEADRLLATGRTTEVSVEPGRAMSGSELLASWRAGRQQLIDAARPVDPKRRVPWYGPTMSAMSCLTARLMETWAHGIDVADALGDTVPATARLRHVAHLGVHARPFSYMLHGLEVPTDPVFVDLDGPDGEVWTWGEPGPDRVVGPALDFCLVVTQRRNVADTALEVTGDAVQWMQIAQAFAGGPGTGRPPAGGSRPATDPS